MVNKKQRGHSFAALQNLPTLRSCDIFSTKGVLFAVGGGVGGWLIKYSVGTLSLRFRICPPYCHMADLGRI